MQTLDTKPYRELARVAKSRGLSGVAQLIRAVAVPEWLQDQEVVTRLPVFRWELEGLRKRKAVMSRGNIQRK